MADLDHKLDKFNVPVAERAGRRHRADHGDIVSAEGV
jgi:hypothetical protein